MVSANKKGNGRSPFPFSCDNKRYHTLHYHLQELFPCRVGKAVINAGFTCPNVDGTKGRGGCIYCRQGGGEFTESALLSPSEQIRRELQRIRKKRPEAMCIAYFQSHTNTYAPVLQLRRLYEEALSVPGVCGLSIATRADCLPADVLDLLEELSHKTYLTVELGLQTVHDKTAEVIRRGHTFSDFLAGYTALQKRGIRTCIHLINGLPGETAEDMLKSAQMVGKLRPQGIKLHLLHVLEGTDLAALWRQGNLLPMEKEAYIRLVCSQLEVFPPETVIERLTGDGSREHLLAPLWSLDKISVLGGIDKDLQNRDSWQGKRFSL